MSVLDIQIRSDNIKSEDSSSIISFNNDELENWVNSLFELRETLTDMYNHINKNV